MAVRFSRPHRKRYLFTFHRWVIKSLNEEQRDSPLSLHHPVQFISPPPFRQQQAPCVRQPGTKKGEQKRRERGMERQEERRMGAYIRTVSSDIFAFSRESHYEYQYGPRERKHSFLSFSLGYSCTKEIYSSQSNGQSVRLCMAV